MGVYDRHINNKHRVRRNVNLAGTREEECNYQGRKMIPQVTTKQKELLMDELVADKLHHLVAEAEPSMCCRPGSSAHLQAEQPLA